MRVLIADDSPAVRQRVASLLDTAEAAEVVGQCGGVVATLSAVQDLEPDVVILDLRMPDGNGLDVLEAMRRGGSKSQVIVLTNFPYPQYRRRCLEAGARYFFDKATEFEKLPQALAQLARSTGSPGAAPPPADPRSV